MLPHAVHMLEVTITTSYLPSLACMTSVFQRSRMRDYYRVWRQFRKTVAVPVVHGLED